MTDPHPIAAAIRDALILEDHESEPGVIYVTNLSSAINNLADAINRLALCMPMS